MNRTTKKLTISAALVAAAFSGIMAGCKSNGASAGTQANSTDPDKHACKGLNACKGKGNCSTGDAGCKGKNSCQGKGGCKTM